MNELNISDLLSIEGLPNVEGEEIVVYEPTVLEDVTSHPNERKIDLESDYSLVRQNLNQQSQMMMAMAKIALENAKNAESPRHVEVFATLMGQLTSTNKELLKIHKDMKDITSEETKTNQAPASNMTIENAQVFLGTPTELMSRIGNSQDVKYEKEKVING